MSWTDPEQPGTGISVSTVLSIRGKSIEIAEGIVFFSYDNGLSWQNKSNGLPAELYMYKVVKNDRFVFAGQWDGAY